MPTKDTFRLNENIRIKINGGKKKLTSRLGSDEADACLGINQVLYLSGLYHIYCQIYGTIQRYFL